MGQIIENYEQRYLEIMVSDKFEGIGGKWYPVYVPCLVPREMIPEFEIVASRSHHAILLDDEGFNDMIKQWNKDMKETEGE